MTHDYQAHWELYKDFLQTISLNIKWEMIVIFINGRFNQMKQTGVTLFRRFSLICSDSSTHFEKMCD